MDDKKRLCTCHDDLWAVRSWSRVGFLICGFEYTVNKKKRWLQVGIKISLSWKFCSFTLLDFFVFSLFVKRTKDSQYDGNINATNKDFKIDLF